jgi:LysM repeat protein
MNRRQLAFVIVINAFISLAIALCVAWVIEARRPDPEELAALAQPAALSAGVTPQNPPTSTTLASSASVNPAPENTVAATPDTALDEATSPAASTGDEEVYVVEVGDSLGAIADRFGVAVADIVAANNLQNPDYVFSGQRLIIPPAGGSAATVAPTSAPGQGLHIGALETPGNLLSEAVSLVNDSNLAINLQGWKLERVGGPAYEIGSVSIFPGGSLWIHSRSGENTSVALFWGQSEAIWQSGAEVRLVNPQGDVIASYVAP